MEIQNPKISEIAHEYSEIFPDEPPFEINEQEVMDLVLDDY
jgi:hypothetical protein